MDAVTSGRMNIHPCAMPRVTSTGGRKRDWCISRQLWWGHRIPIWHCGTCSERDLEKAFAGRNDVVWRAGESGGWLVCPETDLRGDELGPGHTLNQDPDVLDTWFSSALWPHSTLGWPDETVELKKFYPTSVLSTARDIITLWVARMVVFGLFNLNEVPFRDVYIHPIIQDGKGRRMSKSAGNGVDPVDIMEIDHAHALLHAGRRCDRDAGPADTGRAAQAGRRARDQYLRAVRARPQFRQQILECRAADLDEPGRLRSGRADPKSLAIEDRWILDRLDCTIEEVTSDFEQFQFAEAARRLRDFTWGDFCDWYLEFVKGRLRDADARPDAQRVLAAVLDALCRLLHPIIPFVTEQVWQGLNSMAAGRGLSGPTQAAPSVCVAPWPQSLGWRDENARETVGLWCEVIKALRNLKAERNVPKEARIAPILVARGSRRCAFAGRSVLEGVVTGRIGDDRRGGGTPGGFRRGGSAGSRGHLAARGTDRPRGRAHQAAQGAG